MIDNVYYVYAYLRDDGTPFYIGKGFKNRIHDPHKNVITPKDPTKRIFIQQGMLEKDALSLENKLTKQYGLLCDGTGILENKIHGGATCPRGMLGKHHSEKAKRAISESNKGKVRTEEQRNNYKGPKSKEHAENIRKAMLGAPAERYMYEKPFAHKGRPWSESRRQAYNERFKKDLM